MKHLTDVRKHWLEKAANTIRKKIIYVVCLEKHTKATVQNRNLAYQKLPIQEENSLLVPILHKVLCIEKPGQNCSHDRHSKQEY